MHTKTNLLLLSLLAAACGRDVSQVGTKFSGVGYNPDEIAPTPEPHGGLVEYSWVNFAGGGLSLAAVKLTDFTSVPISPGFEPPYVMVYGQAFVFDKPAVGVDNFGVILDVPELPGTCYTAVEPTGLMLMSSTADLGTNISFRNSDGTVGFVLDRVPAEYPSDPQDALVYYSSLSSWRTEEIVGYNAGAGVQSYTDLEKEVLVPMNWRHGEEMVMEYPGGVAPLYANAGSLPFPSSYNPGGSPSITLPNRQEGLLFSWDGPRYDTEGIVYTESGPQSTCLNYNWPEDDAPGAKEDCLTLPKPGMNESYQGQIYTGPWDTTGGLKMDWYQGEVEGDILTLTIRFLGPLDLENDTYIRERMVNYDDPENPEEGRAALPCEEGEWTVPTTFYTREGELVPTLRGDPFHVVTELTCRLDDSAGTFTLTEDLVGPALQAAKERKAEGAIFAITRSRIVEAPVPPVKDNYDNRNDIEDILVIARSMELGRFWYSSATE